MALVTAQAKLARLSSNPLETTGILPTRAHALFSDFPYFRFWKPNLQKKGDLKCTELQFMKVNFRVEQRDLDDFVASAICWKLSEAK